MGQNQIRLITFYLPQYHPIPENDAWWGPGFTEWTNVVKGRPLFPGHYQPQLPADLGFYDLRLPQTRQAQADLAKAFGIHGFCYYHYWFNGKLLLEMPFNAVLESGRPEFPFCLCWANENWTKAWDGLDQQVLMVQSYSAEDDRQHLRWLAAAFRDRRYIRVDGKPLFLVYRISKIPDPQRTAKIWREEARKLGLGDLYLCTVESLRDDRVDPRLVGFDAAVEFQPDWLNLPAATRQLRDNNRVYDYAALVEKMLQKDPPPYPRFPCVAPGWDNTARRPKDVGVINNSTPELYQKWLEQTIRSTAPLGQDEKLIFINAWNEWGEGAYLEPSQKWGRAYLEATRRALEASRIDNPQTVAEPLQNSQGHDLGPAAVSVCIPVYNGAKYLEEAIRSVLGQTLSNFELMIVDDCSTDSSEAIVKSFDDQRIRFFKNPSRLGLVGNWNRCIEFARTQYLCIFHQDDVMLPANLKDKVKLLAENPNVGLVYSSVHQIGPVGELISECWYFRPKPGDEGVHAGEEFFRRLLFGVNEVCCPTVVARKACYEQLGGFDPQLPFTADWEMWLRIALFYDVAYLTTALTKYRRHDQMETLNFAGARELKQGYRAKLAVLEKYPERLPDGGALHARMVRDYQRQAVEQAVLSYRQRQFANAGEYLALAADFQAATESSEKPAEYARRFLESVDQLGRHEPPPPAADQARPVEIERPEASIEQVAAASTTRSKLPLRYQPIFREVLDSLSGRDVADNITIRKILQAIAFKAAAKPGFEWLMRFKWLGKKLLVK